MNAEQLIKSIAQNKTVEQEEVVNLLSAMVTLCSYSREYARRKCIENFAVTSEEAETLLTWGEDNFDLGPNQSFA